jgi:hypothetical protein
MIPNYINHFNYFIKLDYTLDRNKLNCLTFCYLLSSFIFNISK